MWWWWGGEGGTGVENALCSVYGWMPSQHHTAQQHSSTAHSGGHIKVAPLPPLRQQTDRWVQALTQRGANPPGAAVAPRRDHCHNPTPA